MAAIDPHRLTKAMDGASVTTKVLADQVGISIQYATDITKGRRSLKRNPDLRHRIARVLGCPRDWIEVERPEPEAVA